MPKDIDPAHPSAVLEVLPLLGLWPEDAWAEIQEIRQPSGRIAVAVSLRLVHDDGLLVRHVSGPAQDETLGAALERVAKAIAAGGLRSVDIVPGEVDTLEGFYTYERVQLIMAQQGQTQKPIVH